MFWFENIFYVLRLAIFELLLVPFVYIKMLFIIPWSTIGLFTSIGYAAIWLVIGIFLTIFIALRDVVNFLLLLSKLEGNLKKKKDDSEDTT